MADFGRSSCKTRSSPFCLLKNEEKEFLAGGYSGCRLGGKEESVASPLGELGELVDLCPERLYLVRALDRDVFQLTFQRLVVRVEFVELG